ncbi:MAG: tripartite tricarboxylate transporter substrate binding protein [Peptococcaceae bacterium]|jgi:tripartite-type tricarboxylate transporter receptor subunit TctC|nr:tripartite tricarboxylate transporter substrate binding protein [Peptococcaceae bacterium]
MRKSAQPKILAKILAIVLLFCLCFSLAACGGDDPANYPDKSITIHVGFNPGGGVDTAVRGIQPYLQKYIGASVLVENRPGNQGLIAMNYAGEQKADGYTLLATTNAMSLNAMVFPESYKLGKPVEEAMIPIYSWINADGNGLFVSKESPLKTWDDVVAAAQTEKGIKIGGSGIASTDHITLITIQAIYGGNWTFVPMDSAGEVVSAVLGGQLDVGSSSPGGASLDPGRINMLAVTLAERAPKWPDAPTFIELGQPDLYILFVVGLMAPADTPPEIIKKLEDAMAQARNDPDYIAWAENAQQAIGEEGWDGVTYSEYLTNYQSFMSGIIPEIRAQLDAAQQGN